MTPAPARTGRFPPMRREIRSYLAAATKVIVVAVLLGETFTATTGALAKTGFVSRANSSVIAPLIIHTLIIIAARIWTGRPSLGLRSPGEDSPGHSARSAMTVLFIAGPGWLVLVAAAAAMTAVWFPGAPATRMEIPPAFWWSSTVILAPVLEELVYRGLISPVLRRDCGNLAGSYFGAVLFAWVHTSPTIPGILAGNPGSVPPGPLLLALVADWLYVRFGSIWIPVAFHSACNVTPVMFGMLDPRWLDWLGELYQ